MCLMQLKYFILAVVILGLIDLGQDVIALLPSPLRVADTDDFSLDDVHI